MAQPPLIVPLSVCEREGWALTDGELSPIGMLGGPRLEVGEQYLAAWTYSSQRGWVVLSVSAVFPVDDYGRAQRHEWSEPSLAGNAFVGALVPTRRCTRTPTWNPGNGCWRSTSTGSRIVPAS